MSFSCAGPLGTVSPLLRPSWFTAELRMSARTLSPSAIASDRRLSTTTPQPSPRTKPSAAASNVLHLPSAANMRARLKLIEISGLSMRLTPPAKARCVSFICRLLQAKSIATSEDEHAVSTVILGPHRFNRYETRPEAVLVEFPVAQ